MGDERLARLAAAGHARAFAVVYERHHQALYRYCRSILRHDADAQDALQSTFTAAFAALSRGERDAPIRPWLFRIAHNESVSALRRRRPTSELTEAAETSIKSLEDQVAERAEIGLLLSDLHQLSARQRSALVMRELSGLSHEEIAAALGISAGAAKQTIYEARQTLFEFAEGRAMACEEIRRTISDADGRALRSRRVRGHLRECSACARFADSITGRTAQLEALAPVLPGAVAAGLFERILTAGPGHGAGAAGHGAGAAGLAGATAGKIVTAGVAANTLAGMAVVASATVGVTFGVSRLVHESARAGATHPAAAAAPRAKSSPAVSSLGGRAGSSHLGSAAAPASALGAHGSGAPRPVTATRSHGGAQPISGHQPSVAGAAPGFARGRGERHGAGGPAGAGAGSATHGATTTWHPGDGAPPWAGSGKAGSAQSGKPASTGSGRPASAGAGHAKASGSGSSGASGSGQATGSGRSTATGSHRPATAGPAHAGAGRWAVNSSAPSTQGHGQAAVAAVNASTSTLAAPSGPPATPPGQVNAPARKS